MSIQQDIIELENSTRQALELFLLKHRNVQDIKITHNYGAIENSKTKRIVWVNSVKAEVTVFGNSELSEVADSEITE